MLKDLHHAICIYFIVPTWLVHYLKQKNKDHFVFSLHFITKTNTPYQSSIRSSTIPILKPEAVTGNLPDGLVAVWCSLSGQKEVLVEETQFVPFELDCPTSYNKQGGLALGCLLCQWEKRAMYDFCIILNSYINSLIPNTQYVHINLILNKMCTSEI